MCCKTSSKSSPNGKCTRYSKRYGRIQTTVQKATTRTVYKSPQKALERWNQSRQNTVSTAYADAPTIVKAPSGGYSVVPHKLVKKNNLKEIAPSEISKLED